MDSKPSVNKTEPEVVKVKKPLEPINYGPGSAKKAEDAYKAEQFLKSTLAFRPACQEDVNFIFNSWLKSHRKAFAALGISNPVYYAQHHVLVEGLCQTATITVCVNAADHSQIFGYIAHESIEGQPVVHYVYVKEPYRLLGLSKLLLQQAGVALDRPFFCTHRTQVIKHIEGKYPCIYNPYLAYAAYGLGKQVKAQLQTDGTQADVSAEAE